MQTRLLEVTAELNEEREKGAETEKALAAAQKAAAERQAALGRASAQASNDVAAKEVQLQQMLATQERITHQLQLAENEARVWPPPNP